MPWHLQMYSVFECVLFEMIKFWNANGIRVMARGFWLRMRVYWQSQKKRHNFLESKRLKCQDINFNFFSFLKWETWPKSYFSPNVKWAKCIKLNVVRIKSIWKWKKNEGSRKKETTFKWPAAAIYCCYCLQQIIIIFCCSTLRMPFYILSRVQWMH